VLISLRNFAEHGGLYRGVYSQYGPFPFVVYYVLHGLGLPFTHVGGRLITLAVWSGCALGCAALVRQATHSFLLSLAVLCAMFPYLWLMVAEPSHPGGLIAGAIAAAAALGYRSIEQDRSRAWGLVTGALAATLALTKINVGAFIVLSALAWIFLHHENERVRRWAPGLLALGGVLVPLGLMRTLLHVEWVQTFALVFACSSGAAVIVIGFEASPRAGWRTLSACVAGGVVVAAFVLGIIFMRGTNPAELLDGILLEPLKHPHAYNHPYKWPAGTRAFAVVSLLGSGAAFVLRHRGVAAIHPVIAGLRLLAAAGATLAMVRFPDINPHRIVFGYGAPCLWVFLWPLPGETAAHRAARAWIGFLGLGQFLHAFPVAGSQIAWGTFLALPVAAIGGYDAVTWLAARFPRRAGAGWRSAFRGLGIAGIAVVLILGARFSDAARRNREGSDLALPGAEYLRLPTETTALFRLLAMNATAHGDLLFTEPGMFSFNLWTDLPTPTLANVTHWFSLLGPTRQEAIISALQAHPRACIIVQRDHINNLVKRDFAPAGELHDYIATNYSSAFELDGFEFRVRNGRQIDPLLLGEMLVLADTAGTENTALKLRLLLPAGRAVDRIELTSRGAPNGERLVFNARNSRLVITATDPRGTPTGASTTMPWPLRLEGPAMVLIHFDRFAQPIPVKGALITLLGPDGAEVALARLKQ
jgi:hypothetical protein